MMAEQRTFTADRAMTVTMLVIEPTPRNWTYIPFESPKTMAAGDILTITLPTDYAGDPIPVLGVRTSGGVFIPLDGRTLQQTWAVREHIRRNARKG